MSNYEYDSMFAKAQKSGPYHLFTFDIIDSKKMNSFNRNIANDKMIILIDNIVSKLKEIETKNNIKIHHSDAPLTFVDWKSKTINKLTRGDLAEPFILGDLFAITLIRDSLSEKEFYNIYLSEEEKLNLAFSFRSSSGYYETDNYIEGKDKYFRGYAIDYLDRLARKEDKIKIYKKTR